jgi:hypothetical protein
MTGHSDGKRYFNPEADTDRASASCCAGGCRGGLDARIG